MNPQTTICLACRHAVPCAIGYCILCGAGLQCRAPKQDDEPAGMPAKKDSIYANRHASQHANRHANPRSRSARAGSR